jgi:hypothetical protein
MATLFDPSARARLEARLSGLAPDTTRKWGRMTAHQAVCHMSDAFRMALGDRPAAALPTALRPVIKLVAINLPLKWPQGIKTVPEVEQGGAGTKPVEFQRDVAELKMLMTKFSSAGTDALQPTHPIFGRMSARAWGRWGYRHMDHHLRQFGR